jgi:PST family polysaccharide transporter
MSANVYNSSNTVILGLLTNQTTVGYYTAAQRVVVGVQSLWSPVSQAIYPHFCKTFQADPKRAVMQLKRLAGAVAVVTLTGALLLCLSAPYLVPAFLGSHYQHSIGVMQILVFSIAAVTTNSVLGLHGVVAAGLNSDFLRVVAVVTAIDLLLAPLGIKLFAERGLAAVFVCAEVVGCLCWYQTLRVRALF